MPKHAKGVCLKRRRSEQRYVWRGLSKRREYLIYDQSRADFISKIEIISPLLLCRLQEYSTYSEGLTFSFSGSRREVTDIHTATLRCRQAESHARTPVRIPVHAGTHASAQINKQTGLYNK